MHPEDAYKHIYMQPGISFISYDGHKSRYPCDQLNFTAFLRQLLSECNRVWVLPSELWIHVVSSLWGGHHNFKQMLVTIC